jgi:hypothetical protein
MRSSLRITPQISDAPMRVTQNTFMVGARRVPSKKWTPVG